MPRKDVDKQVLDALTRPHSSAERFEFDYPVAFRCPDCQQLGHGPRSQMQEALREHARTCPARRTHADEPKVIQVLYPRR